jgi:hypothetical protein
LPGFVNKVGNNIIDLNIAGSTLTGTYVPVNPDVAGAFTDKGHNIIGSVGNATGFTGAGDKFGVAATGAGGLNLGPLQNNGGATLTDGLLNGSAAINAGSVSLANAAGLSTDQRGTGFPRFNGGTVDAGAFELLPPAITSLSPSSAHEGDPTFELTINGTNFVAGSMVTFGNATLTPDSITGSAITVSISTALLRSATTTGMAAVTVNNPDASGMTGPGHTVISNAATFTIFGPSSVTVNNPGTQSKPENATANLTITSTDSFANGYTDVVAGVHTLPPGLTISSTGVITGTISAYAGDNSPYTVTISAQDDGTVGSTTFTWNVTKVTPPAVTNPGTQTAAAGTSYILTLNSTDANTFTDVVGGAHTLPPGLTISNTGVISGTPPSTDSSSYNVTITAARTGVATTTQVAFTFNLTGTNFPPPPPSGNVDTVVLETNGALIRYINGVGSPQLLSGAGTIKAISTVEDINKQTVVFAITTGAVGAQYNNTLWEFSFGSWSQQTDSSFQFQQISAATNSSGETIVFGLTTNDALYKQTHSSGIDTGLTLLSPAGTIKYISAVTDAAGNDNVYAIVTADNSLWLHTPQSWLHLSTGTFSQVSAGLNTAGQAVVYGVLADGELWEQNPAFGPVGLNTGFVQLSGQNGLAPTFRSVQAGGPDHMFGIASDGTVWQHTPTTNTHVSLTLQARQLSATETQSGTDEVFMTLIDGSFWEYSLALPASHFKELLTGGVASSSTPE